MAKEFKNAKEGGFSSIEWIFDTNPNPITNKEGIHEMSNLIKKSNIIDKFSLLRLFYEKTIIWKKSNRNGTKL